MFAAVYTLMLLRVRAQQRMFVFWCSLLQVREARDAAREAAGLLQELQRFVQDEGPDGDWRAWVSSHVANTGVCWLGRVFVVVTVGSAATKSA